MLGQKQNRNHSSATVLSNTCLLNNIFDWTDRLICLFSISYPVSGRNCLKNVEYPTFRSVSNRVQLLLLRSILLRTNKKKTGFLVDITMTI